MSENENQKLENLKKEKKSNGHGGKRNNSGRKPRMTFEARELFNKFVDDNWPTIMAGLKKHIKKGDKFVLDKLVEQRIGKAPQTLKVGGDEEGKPIQWQLVNYGDNKNNNSPV